MERVTENRKDPKCNKEEGICKSLFDRTDDVNYHGKGFGEVCVMDFSTRDKPQIKSIGVVYRTSAKDRGLMLNFCPFCGGNIAWWRKAADA